MFLFFKSFSTSHVNRCDERSHALGYRPSTSLTALFEPLLSYLHCVDTAAEQAGRRGKSSNNSEERIRA